MEKNIIPFGLFEAFDSALPITKDSEHRKEVESFNLPISAVTVWKTVATEQEESIYFYEYKFKGAWEFHFNIESLEVGYKNTPRFSRAQYNKIIGTIVKIMTERLDRNPSDTFRVYGIDKRMTELYMKALKYVTKKKNMGEFIVKKVENYVSPTKDTYTAYELKKDTRTLKLKDLTENYL